MMVSRVKFERRNIPLTLREYSVELPLPETLRRLRDHAGEHELNPQELADQTALPERTVRALLRGEELLLDRVEERVCTRVKTLADAHSVRTEKRFSDLVTEVAGKLKISEVWARKLLRGEKMPNVALLHGLAEHFEVEGGEAFFTAPPAEALNRVLLAKLAKYENPSPDPVTALMEKHGIVGTDLRLHGSHLTNQQLEDLLAGVLRTFVSPPTGESER
jgi:transcriptional regulator with XRE-family HTH domain